MKDPCQRCGFVAGDNEVTVARPKVELPVEPRYYFLVKGGHVLHFSPGKRKDAWCGRNRGYGAITNMKVVGSPNGDIYDNQKKCATCLAAEDCFLEARGRRPK